MIQRADRPQPGPQPQDEAAPPERDRGVTGLSDPAPERVAESTPESIADVSVETVRERLPTEPDSTQVGPSRPELLGQLESMLFVAGEPLPTKRIADLLGEETALIRGALGALQARYDGPASGVRLAEIAGGWRLLTRPEHADTVAALAGKRVLDRLSPAALETLAIIAYKQPVGRAEVERIRGVGVGPILRHLLELDLIKVAGREEGLGRALLYGTTRAFLDRFGLKSVKDLPASLEL